MSVFSPSATCLCQVRSTDVLLYFILEISHMIIRWWRIYRRSVFWSKCSDYQKLYLANRCQTLSRGGSLDFWLSADFNILCTYSLVYIMLSFSFHYITIILCFVGISFRSLCFLFHKASVPIYYWMLDAYFIIELSDCCHLWIDLW